MTGLENAAYAALVTLVESTYSGLTAVIRDGPIGRINWENLAANGSLVAPFAVVRLGPAEPEGWGMDNLAFRLSVGITLVVSLTDSGATITGGFDVTAYLLQQLGLLRESLIEYSGGAFQLAGDLPVVDVSTTTESNQILVRLEAPFQAGEVRALILIGQIGG